MCAGDERAFDEFFDGYFPGLYRFAVARVNGDADAAEDIVQTALARAVSKLHTFRGEAALFTWLCTFCRHEISTHYRRHPRGGTTELAEEAPDVRAALESLTQDGEWRAQQESRRQEIARLVQVALDHLPPKYGRALEWKYLEGASVNEIAERLGVGPKAAESLLTRARGAFRDGFAALTGSTGLAEVWPPARTSGGE
jgi:RNA polymerase sigma-70 factor, ECF subfamily